MCIGKSTSKRISGDNKRMRVKGGACKIRRWIRPSVSSEGMCKGRGHIVGTSSSLHILEVRRVYLFCSQDIDWESEGRSAEHRANMWILSYARGL